MPMRITEHPFLHEHEREDVFFFSSLCVTSVMGLGGLEWAITGVIHKGKWRKHHNFIHHDCEGKEKWTQQPSLPLSREWPEVLGPSLHLSREWPCCRVSVTPIVTGVTRLQGTHHSPCHGSDRSPGCATSIFAFPNLNPCNVIVILVTLNLFWHWLAYFNAQHT